MTVYKQKGRRTYIYDFEFRGRRYCDTTHQTNKQDAARVEAKEKERLRHIAGGIAIPTRDDSPAFQEWAEIFWAYKEKRLERPEALGDILPVALRFWGKPDGITPSDEHPCHDLRLMDPVLDPTWITRFDGWLEARGLSNQSKNHYRGLLRRMYAVALLPEYRQVSGVTMNPFAGVPNDPTMERSVALSPAQVKAVLKHASYHVRLAIAIAALAPKLRLRNILELRWADSFEPDPRRTKFSAKTSYYLVVHRHKTARRTRRPLVSPISSQLRTILKDAWTRNPTHAHVVTYRGEPLTSIRDGVKAAVEAAGVAYGRDTEDGATFHTLRHTAATLLAEHEGDPLKFMDVTGHTDLATALKYRHLRPQHQLPALERLSKQLPLQKLVMARPLRANRRKAG